MTECPPDTALVDLLASGADPTLETHVQSCGRCRTALDRLTGPDGRSWHTVAAPPPLRPGPPDVAVPGYELVREIGRGGHGIVYEARDTVTGRRVAVKRLRDDALALGDRFDREVRAAARLAHPHVVPVYHVGEAGGRRFVAMELLAGGTLAARAGGRPLAEGEAVRLVAAVARGVAAAHAAGVTHRDLKPANILLDAAGTPKVADFGLAALDGESFTPTSALLGTPEYLAPEVAARGSRAAGPAADVYSLGAVLYEMLVGRPPFRGATPFDTLRLARWQEPDPPRALRRGLTRGLDAVVLKCLEKEPGRRYQTAAALADDLDRAAAGRSVLARPPGPAGRAARWARQRPAVAALAGLLVAVTAGGLVGLTVLWRRAAHTAAVAAHRLDTTRQALAAYMATAERRFWNPAGVTPEERAELDRAFALQAQLAADYPDDPAARFKAGYAMLQLADINRRLGVPADRTAVQTEAAVGLLRGVVAADPGEPRFRAGLAEGCAQLSVHRSAAGRPTGGLVAEAAALARRLVAERPDSDHYRGLVAAFDLARAAELAAAGRPAEAAGVLEGVCDQCRGLAAKYPADPCRRNALAAALVNLAQTAACTDPGPDRAAACLAEAAGALEAARALAPDRPVEWAGLATVRGLAARLAVNAGRPADAAADLARGLDVATRLAADCPAVPEYRSVLAGLLLQQTTLPGMDPESARAARGAYEKLATAPDAPPALRAAFAAWVATDPARAADALRLAGPFPFPLGVARLEAGDAAGAVAALDQAAADEERAGRPAPADVSLYRAMARWRAGDRAGARADLTAGSAVARSDWLTQWETWAVEERAWRLIEGRSPSPRRLP